MISRVSLTLASSLLLAFAACGNGDGNGNGTPDSGQNGGPDAFAGPGCAPSFANCEGLYQDLTNEDAVTINTPGSVYAPKCIRIKPGTQVTIEASSLHPLESEPCAPEEFVGGRKTTTETYTLNELGVHGYFCTTHRGIGMMGAIDVVE